MKKFTTVKSLALATAVAGAMSMPTTAAAEVSATLEIASQYIFRGLVEETGNAQVSGSLDYEHDSGVYVGVWSGSIDSGVEMNYYAGFAGEIEDFSYDIGLLHYRFPGADQQGVEEFLTEAYLELGYMGLGFGAYIGVDKVGTSRSKGDDNKDNYFTLSYEYEQFGALVGYFDADDKADEYSHLDLTYEALPGLTFMASHILDAEDDFVSGTQFVVAYEFSF